MGEKLEARRNMYGLISRLLLLEMDLETLNFLKNNEDVLSLFPNLKEWDKFGTIQAQKLIEEYFNVDFTNLLLIHLIPYESFYKRDDQMINSGGENPLVEFYNNYDFRVDLTQARAISPDHIAIECEFMSLLVDAELKAFNQNDTEAIKNLREIQKEFMQKHLLTFAPMFLINMKSEAKTPLYYDLAEMTMEFLLSDFEEL